MTKKWKVILLVFFVVVLILIASGAFLRMNTKKHSPSETITFNENGLSLKTVYCRPYKKNRLIFGEAEDGALQPFGEYWRLGANEATTLELNKNVMFAGKSLKAGIYAVYAIPGKDTWKIGVNSGSNRWGYAEPDYNKDVISVMVPVLYSDEIVEQFKIKFEPIAGGAEMVLKWDTSVIRIPIK